MKIHKLFVCNIYPDNSEIVVEDIAIDGKLVDTLINPQTSEQKVRQASEALGRMSLALC
jgi:hypothetical protein